MTDLLGECVGPLVAAHPEFRFRTRRAENPSGYVVETIRAVLQALFDTDTFESCLIDVVNRGGDADTTGAIAGMVAGAVYGRAAIPSYWVDVVDTAITQACEQQARALIGLSRSPPRAECGEAGADSAPRRARPVAGRQAV